MATEAKDNPDPKPNPSTLMKIWRFIVWDVYMSLSLVTTGLGIALGFILKDYLYHSNLKLYFFDIPGEHLSRLLSLVSGLPILFHVVIEVYTLSLKYRGKIVWRAAQYYSVTTTVAVIIGLILVLVIKPGAPIAGEESELDEEESLTPAEALLNVMMNIVPPNPVAAWLHMMQLKKVVFEKEEQNFTLGANATDLREIYSHVKGVNVLGLIMLAIGWTLIFTRMGNKARVLVKFIAAFIAPVDSCAIFLVPGFLSFGLLSFITQHVIEDGNWETTVKLGKFTPVVLLGLIIHGAIVLPAMYFFTVGRNPGPLIKQLIPVLSKAFLTSSSTATQLKALQVCEDKLGLNRHVTGFMLPTGIKINKEGSVLCTVISVVFIAQLSQINLNLSQLIIVAITAAVTNFGTPGIKATGLLGTSFVLTSVGLSVKYVGLLMVVAWLLDHFCTAINILVQCIGAAIVSELQTEREETNGQEMQMTRESLNHL